MSFGKGLTLPNNKFFDWSKFKASADDKINVNEKSKFVLGREENIVGKGENAGYQKASLSRSLKVGFVWLPNIKFFDWSKLIASADDKINVNEKLKFVLGRVENIVGKGENVGYQKASLSRSLKVGFVW